MGKVSKREFEAIGKQGLVEFWYHTYPVLSRRGDESTAHVTLHLCGSLLVCDQHMSEVVQT